MVAERDLFLPKHPELEKIPNLHVIKALQVCLCSFSSCNGQFDAISIKLTLGMSIQFYSAVKGLYNDFILQSLKSRGYVEENFAWRHYYWRLTNEGIQYLREYLHLPAEVCTTVSHLYSI